jgi:hypothetical protein
MSIEKQANSRMFFGLLLSSLAAFAIPISYNRADYWMTWFSSFAFVFGLVFFGWGYQLAFRTKKSMKEDEKVE